MGTLTLVDTDDGKRIDVRQGDRIEIHLAENPTTGYRWAVEEIGEGASIEFDEFHIAGTPLVPGAGGVHEWHIAAKASGHAALRLKLWRDWEGEQGVIRRFAVDFEID